MPKYLIDRDLPRARHDVVRRDGGHHVHVRTTSWPGWHRTSNGCTVTSPPTRCTASTSPTTPTPLHEHARRGGFQADAVNQIALTIDPTTAEAA